MSIKEELNNGSFKSCTKSSVKMESCTCYLCSCFRVKNIQVLADIPVCQRFKVKFSRFAPFSYFNVFAVVLAYWSCFRRNVRYSQESISLLCFEFAYCSIVCLYLFRNFLHLCHNSVSILAVFLHNRNLLCHFILLSL